MLRWTRAWSLPLGGLGPCCLSSSRVPVAPSSSGRSGVEPRSVLLSYKLLDGEATRPALVFLHGLFGSKTNFNSIAKALAHQTGRRDMAERQFLLTNLVEVDGRFVWRVNLEALAQHVDKILAFPPRPESYPGPTLFLLGGNSQYVRPSHHAEIRRLFPQAQMQTVPNAGHWIHADCPQDFVAAIRGFLA